MYKYRRDRLLDLIEREYGGERVRFCDSIDMSESRLAQILSTTYRDGTAFTEKTARKLERAAKLPPLYFDQGAVPGVRSAAPVPTREAMMVLAYEDEQQLLDLYRRTDSRGRDEIMGTARDEAARAVAAEARRNEM